MSTTVIRHLADLDLRGNALRNAALESLATAPANPVAGQLYFDTALGFPRVYSGSEWLRMDDKAAQAAIAQLQAQVGTDITAALATEEAARIAGDAALQSALNTEISTRGAADTALQGNIDDVAADLVIETTARTAADATLTASISTEVTARTDADTALGVRIDGVVTSVSDEAAARVAGDNALGLRVDGVIADLADEATDRIAGDAATLSAAAADATSKANAAEANANTYTDGKITALVNGADAALDTLKEIGDALAADDTAIAGIITTLGTKQDKSSLISDVRAGVKYAASYSVTGEFAQVVAHNLGTANVTVQVFEGGYAVECGIQVVDANSVKVSGNAGATPITLDVVVAG